MPNFTSGIIVWLALAVGIFLYFILNKKISYREQAAKRVRWFLALCGGIFFVLICWSYYKSKTIPFGSEGDVLTALLVPALVFIATLYLNYKPKSVDVYESEMGVHVDTYKLDCRFGLLRNEQEKILVFEPFRVVHQSNKNSDCFSAVELKLLFADRSYLAIYKRCKPEKALINPGECWGRSNKLLDYRDFLMIKEIKQYIKSRLEHYEKELLSEYDIDITPIGEQIIREVIKEFGSIGLVIKGTATLNRIPKEFYDSSTKQFRWAGKYAYTASLAA